VVSGERISKLASVDILKFHPCANFQTLLYTGSLYVCSCSLFTSQSAWQQRVECSGLSGVSVYWTGPLSYWRFHIILCVVLEEAACYLGHLKNFLIDCLDWSIRLLRHYSGRWPLWLVRPWLWPGRERPTRQQARKLQFTGLSAAAHQLTGSSQLWSCGGRGRASDHWATCHHPTVKCQSMRQLIASNTVNKQRLTHSCRAGLQPCMFGCSAGYILLTLSSLAVYFISLLLYTWEMRLGSADRPHLQKISGFDATAVRSPLAVLIVCHSLVWHWPCAASAAGSDMTSCPNTSPRRRCLLLSDLFKLQTAPRQTYMPEPGTDIWICIGFQNSISGLTKKSILTSLIWKSKGNVCCWLLWHK